jgi:hypothetical protein
LLLSLQPEALDKFYSLAQDIGIHKVFSGMGNHSWASRKQDLAKVKTNKNI